MNNTVKKREAPESNYRSIYLPSGKTIRMAINSDMPITELDHPEFYDIKLTASCKGACEYCLVEDTLIPTIDGLKKISDIKINDVVINLNHSNFEFMTNPVSQIFKRDYEGELIVIKLSNDIEIKITPNHKVYTKNRGFIRADELTLDDSLFYFD